MPKDEVLTGEAEDDINIVEVDEMPEDAGEPEAETKEEAKADDAKAEPEDEEDDEDDEDERLAKSDEDEGSDKGKPTRRPNGRLTSAERRKRTKEAQALMERRVQQAEARTAELERMVNEIRGHQTAFSESDLDRRIADIEADIRAADQIMAAALTAGNGTDFVDAQKIRDQARDALNEATRAREVLKNRPSPESLDVNRFKTQWMSDNPWFGRVGNEVATQITRTIDDQIAKEGYQPNTEAYWRELSRRVGDHFQRAQDVARQRSVVTTGDKDDKGPKKAPPMGSGKEHAPTSTRDNTFYVTPERKAAMQEAGLWDDPVARKRMLENYRKYDRENARNR